MAQIANQVLGIDVSRVQVIHGDTGNTPFSTGTYASRSIVMSGGAVANACKELIPRIVRIGAHLMKSPEAECRFESGKVLGPAGTIALADITEAWYMRPERLPDNVDRQGLEASVAFKPKRDTGAFSYASHAVAVAVDTDTGQVEILDYVVVEDCGTLVNPAVVEHQAIGGIAQGIGTAMYEEQQYDANGQPNASTLADYLIPGPTEIPNIRIFHLESPSPYTEFGIKGMGEGGAIAPPAVIFNAVNNALDPLGVEVRETPLTPEKLLAAIERAKSVPRREAA
jgi:aerobic carbon-monoxide dehydrogenase large subunit